MPLTDIECRRAAPGSDQYPLPDEKGLALRINPNGSKLWYWSYRFNNKQRRAALGPYPEVSLAEAREQRTLGRKLLREGTDPADFIGTKSAVAAKRAAAKAEADATFERYARDWFVTNRDANRWAPAHHPRLWTRLENHVLPYIGKMAIAEITERDVLSMLRVMEGKGLTDSVRQVNGFVSAIFRFAKIEGAVPSNPASEINDALAPRPKPVSRASVAPDELPEFFASMNQPHTDAELTRIALRLNMHTVLRSAELRNGQWSQIKGDEWHVPEGQMKKVKGKSLPHIVPLSRQSLALLDRLREITGGSKMMFPSQKPGKVMSENTVLFCIYGMGWKHRATGHGFRSTFSTHAHESGQWESNWIEMQLAHVERNQVRGAYNKALYLPHRKRLMQWWSDFLDEQEAKAPKLAKPAAALSEAIDPELAAMLG